MSSRSKREVAPPPPPLQAASGAAPWWPMAPPHGVHHSTACPSNESMGFPSAGPWNAPPPPLISPGPFGFGAVWGAPPSSKDGMTSDPLECGVDYSPPGGLVSYLQSGLAPFPAPWPPACKETQPAPAMDSSSQHAAPRSKAKPVDTDDTGDGKKSKRAHWTEDEDVRLVSAWLHNSNDPINGNGKKNEKYWMDVLADYNKTTPISRRRELKQLKERFQKIKRWVGFFCGMLGSIDCMHWRWEKCPTAWKGQYTRGDYGVPTIILEAVASHDLRIWHAFFGVAGSNNDLNVLNQSPLFIEALKGKAPRVQYFVNGNEYNTGYYLADGIYPEWAAFVKSITSPQLEKHKVYAQNQEGARKDVERTFGVLQGRFNIVRRPARLWSPKILENIMQACVILHNMIVEDEGEKAEEALDLNDTPSTSIVLPPEAKVGTNSNPCFDDVRRRNAAIRARPIHTQLKTDLVEHIWRRFGNRQRH